MSTKAKIEELSAFERKITVEIPHTVIEEEMEHYYQSLTKQTNLKGFRPGKAPIEVIRTQFKGQVIKDVISHLIEKTYADALKTNDIYAIDYPKIDSTDYEEGKSLKFTAVVEIKPDIHAKDYIGIALEKEKVAIDPKRVDENLEQLKVAHAKLKTVIENRPVKDKDFVVMDFEGRVEGKPFPGGSAQNFLYELGSHRFIPGFEDGLLGMKSTEEKDISVVFPNDFHEKKLAGKPVVFKVTLREIKEKEIPVLNDDFAKEVEGCQTLDELKKKILNNLTQSEEHRIKKELESQLLQKLVEKNKLVPPPSMIKRQHAFLVDDAKERLNKMGLPKEKVEDQIKGWEQNLKEKAEFDVKVILLLESVSHKEKLELNEEELDQGLEKIAKSAGTTLTKVKAYYKEKGTLSQIKWQLLQDKTLDHLLTKARVKEKNK